MRIPYGFTFVGSGMLEINIYHKYVLMASRGKAVGRGKNSVWRTCLT